MIGLTHNVVTSPPMSLCGSNEDRSMGGAVGALFSLDEYRYELFMLIFFLDAVL